MPKIHNAGLPPLDLGSRQMYQSLFGRLRLEKEAVPVGCVVDDKVTNDLDVTRMRLPEPPVKIGERTELWIDILIIAHVVSKIHLRRLQEAKLPT